jgi:hypothetical protein
VPDLALFVNLGIGGMFLVVLFLGLARGLLFTKPSVDIMMAEKEARLKDKDAYIAKIEEINKKVDERNDLLASKIDHVIEIARAQGMIEALPPSVGERVVNK